MVASGTEIITELGEEHVRTGSPILYTSADSVFQIAAHQDIIPLAELYHICEIARAMLTGDHAVGRVIARPFIGRPEHSNAQNIDATSHWPHGHYPTRPLKQRGKDVIGLGKIEDLFAGRASPNEIIPRPIVKAWPQHSSLEQDFSGLLFVNLVEFDMLWGHRRDSQGYAQALREVDQWLPLVQERMRPGDALFFTADHGVDPTYRGTDHTRECVPLLAYGEPVRSGIELGVRPTFADLGQTLAEAFGVEALAAGTSFAHELGVVMTELQSDKNKRVRLRSTLAGGAHSLAPPRQ